MIDTTFIYAQSCKILFDYSVRHSFIFERFITWLDVLSIILSSSISILLSIGDYLIANKACICDIEISHEKLEIGLIVLPLIDFVVILDMNWFSRYEVCINCSQKKVSLTCWCWSVLLSWC